MWKLFRTKLYFYLFADLLYILQKIKVIITPKLKLVYIYHWLFHILLFCWKHFSKGDYQHWLNRIQFKTLEKLVFCKDLSKRLQNHIHNLKKLLIVYNKIEELYYWVEENLKIIVNCCVLIIYDCPLYQNGNVVYCIGIDDFSIEHFYSMKEQWRILLNLNKLDFTLLLKLRTRHLLSKLKYHWQLLIWIGYYLVH